MHSASIDKPTLHIVVHATECAQMAARARAANASVQKMKTVSRPHSVGRESAFPAVAPTMIAPMQLFVVMAAALTVAEGTPAVRKMNSVTK